jgi:hypothetical protein
MNESSSGDDLGQGHESNIPDADISATDASERRRSHHVSALRRIAAAREGQGLHQVSEVRLQVRL